MAKKFAEQLHVALDLVGDVRHHLDGSSEIVSMQSLMCASEFTTNATKTRNVTLTKRKKTESRR